MQPCKFGVIAVTETWANEHNESLLTIPGYHGLFTNRIDRWGGGVALFIDDSLSYSERNDINVFAGDEFESYFIELDEVNIGNKLIDVIYHPPGKEFDKFQNNLDNLLAVISKNKRNCILTGDFNLDLLKSDTH